MSLAVNKYSAALFETAKQENCLNEVYEQFKQVYRELCENKEFAKILDTKILTAAEKKEIFTKALAVGNAYLVNFFKLLVDRDRTEELKEMFVAFEKAYKEEKNILEASAVTAIPLSEDELEKIKSMLSEKYQKTVILDNTVDESIIGGMILYVGNTMLDASVRSKLNGLKDRLRQIKIS